MSNQKVNRVISLKKNFILALFCIGGVFSSKAAVTFGATQTATATHKTCYVNTSNVAYLANVVNITNPPTGQYVCGTDYTINLATTKFELRSGTLATGTLIATKFGTDGTSTCVGSYGGNNLAGTFDMTAQAVGIYTIFATIYVNDIPEARTKIVTTQTTFILGYNTQWNAMDEMTVGTTTNSTKRTSTASGSTYSYIQSLNTVGAGVSSWLEIKKKVATTNNDSRIFCVLSAITGANLATFDPNGNHTYIEFYSTTSSTTIRMKYHNGTGYVMTTLSTTATDKVRFQRLGNNSCAVQLNGSGTNLVSPTFTLAGSLNITVFAKQLNDEALELVSTYPCQALNSNLESFALLEKELDGSYTRATSGTVKFTFDEEYRIASGKYIPLKVYDENRVLKASVAFDGTLGASAVAAMKLQYNFDDNRYSLPINSIGLTIGNYYLLEVSTSTGEKKYLKFLYTN